MFYFRGNKFYFCLFAQFCESPGKSWNFVKDPVKVLELWCKKSWKSEKKSWKVVEFESVFWIETMPHHPPAFATFPTSPSSHLQLKHSKITTLGLLSLSTLVLKRRFAISELKSKFIFSPPRKWSWTAGPELWFANY